MRNTSLLNHENRATPLPLDGGGCGWGCNQLKSPLPQFSPTRGEEVFLKFFNQQSAFRAPQSMRMGL